MKMWKLMETLFPIERCITGDGVRDTLRILQKEIPLAIHEVKTPVRAFDWELPHEWFFHRAMIRGIPEEIECWPLYGAGSFNGRIGIEEFEEHVYTLPERPNAIPYVTNYYGPGWGIAMRHRTWIKLKAQYKDLHVTVDCGRAPGALTYADLVIPGWAKDEILLSSYICHPKMANNELSGPVVLTELVKWILSVPRRYTYRVFLGPETIGPLVYLSQHYEQLRRDVRAGWVLTCLGGPGDFSLQRTRNADTLADRVSTHVLHHCTGGWFSVPWKDRASDERQWAAPNPNLPVCSIRKTFPFDEYHTSDDNLDFVKPAHLETSLGIYEACIRTLEANRTLRTATVGEPQMSRRGLYPTVSTPETCRSRKTMLDVLSLCDGRDLLDVANVLNRPLTEVVQQARKLVDEGLLNGFPSPRHQHHMGSWHDARRRAESYS